MALKVIGAGFGRTGTRSLKYALEELGFEKCYHMEEVIKHPSHLKRWADVMKGGASDWEALFHGYQAATDWPTAAYYQELMTVYPDARVILTVREPEGWHTSVMNTLYQVSRRFNRFTKFIPPLHQFLNGMEKVVWQGIFQNRVEDKCHAVRVFNEHIEEVKRIVPRERLLVFEAGQGWEPLCAFLGVPVPMGKPYPHRNSGTVVRWLLKYRAILKWGAVSIIIVFLYLLIRTLTQF
ncbi:MAG: sulfotransferase family protein [Chloroflexi bacterium]|nr:sulfotransferase family protein [Chloroflexota bacterium]